MFTGLIEKVAIVKNFINSSEGGRISLEFSAPDVKTGDSIALNGVCLTVSEIKDGVLTFDVMSESLSVTNLKNLKKGSKVNLERAMSANSRFDGHLVSGHIDTVAKVKSIKQDGFSKRIEFEADTELIVLKGSVALNGVSLTVCGVFDDSFEVSLIPETQNRTNLGEIKPGDFVNIEYDIIGKYLHKFTNQKERFKITEEYLKENGF